MAKMIDIWNVNKLKSANYGLRSGNDEVEPSIKKRANLRKTRVEEESFIRDFLVLFSIFVR